MILRRFYNSMTIRKSESARILRRTTTSNLEPPTFHLAMKCLALLLPLLALAAAPARAEDPVTNESNALAARVSIVPAKAADPECSAVATTNGWSEIQNAIGDFFGGVEYVALETRAFTDGIVVARSNLEKNTEERRLRCEERFLRWDALASAVSFGEDQADSAAVPTNAPPVRATARFVEETTGRKDRKNTLSPDWTTLVEACYQHPTHAWADVSICARTVDGAVEVKRSIVPLAGDGRVLETVFHTIPADAIPTEIKLPEGTVQIR